MKLVELSQETLRKLSLCDGIEPSKNMKGPKIGRQVLRCSNPEFIILEGHPVLLLVAATNRGNITIL